MNPSITTVNENQYLKQIKSSRLTKKKRARATPDQVSVLEGVFAINISPNSKLRRQLAEQLNMNERSVQIWFQNKRAKIK
ncbi:Homeodomain-like protein, partial [Rhizopus microsporus ATCC 52813]